MPDGVNAPRLIAISDLQSVGVEASLKRAEALCSACVPGSVLVQLRDRELPVRALLSAGRALRKICAESGQGFAVNDRADLALLLQADALHLAESSVRIQDARRIWERRIYAAAHSEASVLESDADAVVLAPVMASRKGAPALGLAALERLRAALSVRSEGPRLYALGGVTPEGAEACLRAGADGVAAQGAVWRSEAPLQLAAALGICT